MKKYEKPVINNINIQSVDIITTSDDAVVENFVANVAIAEARTQAYNFNELFGR